ncbi:MAG: hypothetical protein M1833_006232 [Piccolia ochrophora]|nr:MAG: hypothetical protein M1833_006232 [Piccolia ochrophora]
MASNTTAEPEGLPKTSDPAPLIPIEAGSFASLVNDVLNDCLDNLIHDVVLTVHREEKMARARSATFLAEAAATEHHNANNAASAGDTSALSDVDVEMSRFETTGAIYDKGKVYLKGNPLVTTKQIICETCRLPRLEEPPAGTEHDEPGTQYCSRHPPVAQPGRDIHGNPFLAEGGNNAKTNKEKKEKGALLAASVGSPAPSVSGTKEIKTTFPSVKCPHCPRYLMVTRIARHLEKCLGIGGRNGNQNATTRSGTSQGRNSSTPYGSRTGTPVPGTKKSPDKRYREEDDEDDDEEEETPKKKKKKVVKKPTEKSGTAKPKKKDLKADGKWIPGLGEKSKNGVVEKLSTQSPEKAQDKVTEKISKPSNKRALDEDSEGFDDTPKKKKIKSSTANGAGSKPIERPKLNGTKPPPVVKAGSDVKLGDVLDDEQESKKGSQSPAAPVGKKTSGSNTNGMTPKKRKAEEATKGDMEKGKKAQELKASAPRVGA